MNIVQIKTVALLHALVTKQVVARGRKWPVVASAGGGFTSSQGRNLPGHDVQGGIPILP